MIKAKLTALAVVGTLLAGLGGSVAIGPAPALSLDRAKQCRGILDPAIAHTEAAMEAGAALDQPGIDYAARCEDMKRHEKTLVEDARDLAVCEGLKLGGQEQVTLDGLLKEVALSREAISESRAAICEAAG